MEEELKITANSSPAQSDIDNPHEGPTDQKQHLELEKLSLEVAALRRKWWESPTLVSTLVASLFTIGVSWYAGLFDLKQKEIALETSRAKFERDQIKADISRQEDIQARIKSQSTELEERKDALSITVKNLEKQRAEALRAAEASESGRVRAEESEKAAIARTEAMQRRLRDLARPALEITRSAVLAEKKYHFRVENWGPGPAFLKRMQFFVDGHEVIGESIRSVADELDINETFLRWYDFDPGTRVPKGAELKFIWLREEEYSYVNVARFTDATDRLSIAACYCSIDDRCGWAKYGQVPQALGACR